MSLIFLVMSLSEILFEPWSCPCHLSWQCGIITWNQRRLSKFQNTHVSSGNIPSSLKRLCPWLKILIQTSVLLSYIIVSRKTLYKHKHFLRRGSDWQSPTPKWALACQGGREQWGSWGKEEESFVGRERKALRQGSPKHFRSYKPLPLI